MAYRRRSGSAVRPQELTICHACGGLPIDIALQAYRSLSGH
jgi:hypothetical protein